MIELKKHFNLLGLRVKDRITGYHGVVTSIGFDLYGCIQAVVNPGVGADGKPQEAHWFDVNRLEVTDIVPIMIRPTYEWSPESIATGGKGPESKPLMSRV